VESTDGKTVRKLTFKLDGTESSNQMPLGEMKAVAKWDGDKLIIAAKIPRQTGGVRENTDTWSLNGDVLTILSTDAGGLPKRVYTKVK
jgi:hypothetical protein